ncbi:ATP-binding protein [Romboutsia sp.]|uniref:ATP-binding protein n=1 Tax=Romboutsia sp. TaxID=1965302 RepID=UPI003F29FA4B
MEIYALVGSSGTGKSYKALELSYDNEIDYIIDDGILIYKNKILSGISSKQANTTMEAVKRAIFLNHHHRKEVKTKIKEEEIKKILIIGTSKKMVNQIADKLELGKIEKYIDIKDISTEQEINEAKISRKKGNHIIPVPTIEIKSMTSGLKIESLKRKLFRKNNKTEEVLEKTIIRPIFSYRGKFFISTNVIEDIIKHEMSKIEYIDKINKIDITNINNIISVNLNINICNVNQIKNCSYIQEKIKNNIEEITSINVEKVDIYINKLKFK